MSIPNTITDDTTPITTPVLVCANCGQGLMLDVPCVGCATALGAAEGWWARLHPNVKVAVYNVHTSLLIAMKDGGL